jgi:PKD repeat protein
LAACATTLALSTGGCNTEAFCKDRTLLGFLFCDPALVEAEPAVPETNIRRLNPRDGFSVSEPLVDQEVFYAADTVGANDPLYPGGYIAREEWDMDGDGTYERAYPYGGSSFLYAYTAKGPQTVRLRVTDREDNVTEREATFTVKVNPDSPRNRPRAALTLSNQSPRVGEQATFDASGSSDPDGRIVDYEWRLWNDIFHTTTPSLTYTFPEPRENNAILKVTDDDGLTDEASVPYRVGNEGENVPLASMTIAPNPALTGDRVVFTSTSTDPGGRIVRYQWDLDGDNDYELDSTEPITPERTFEVPGTYNVRLLVTDDEGWPDTAFEQVVVNPRQVCDPGYCKAAISALRAGVSPFGGIQPAAAADNRFYARLAVRKVSARGARGARSRRSRKLSDVGAAGSLRGSIVGPPGQPAPAVPKALAGFLQSKWTGELDLTALAGGRHRATALVLATPRRKSSGRVCVRVTLNASPGKRGQGTFQVLGGTGPAARLRAKGRFGFELRPKGNVVLSGTITQDSGKARKLPRRCR